MLIQTSVQMKKHLLSASLEAHIQSPRLTKTLEKNSKHVISWESAEILQIFGGRTHATQDIYKLLAIPLAVPRLVPWSLPVSFYGIEELNSNLRS